MLGFTAKHGNVEMVRHILDRQTNADDAKGKNISLALASALESNRDEEIVEFLLKRKKLIEDSRKEEDREYMIHYSTGGRHG